MNINIPNSYMNRLYGYQIVESLSMVDVNNPEHVEQKRTWKERLFTLPWRPFKKTKTLTIFPPLKNYYLIGNTILCHPAMKQGLIAAMRTEGSIS